MSLFGAVKHLTVAVFSWHRPTQRLPGSSDWNVRYECVSQPPSPSAGYPCARWAKAPQRLMPRGFYEANILLLSSKTHAHDNNNQAHALAY
jgi:hypothetical protein